MKLVMFSTCFGLFTGFRAERGVFSQKKRLGGGFRPSAGGILGPSSAVPLPVGPQSSRIGGVLSAPTKENGLITNHATVGKSNFPIKILSNYDGSLLVKYPWPGCFSEVTSDREPDYWGKYNFFNLHDQGYYDGKSFLFIGGRTDDVINISGHRISTAEIESCCIGSSLKISEAAAVGINDEITGSKIVLFCVSQNNTFNDQEILKLIIKKNLTPFHRPWKVIFISTLPKTKSGKIARRLLRRALSQDFNFKNEDLSTIMNYQEFLLALKEISLS